MNRSFWQWGVASLCVLGVTLALASCRAPLPTLVVGPPPFSLSGVAQVLLTRDSALTVQPTTAAPHTVALTTTATVTAPQTISTTLDLDQAALVERGYTVYLQQYCGVCHQLAAAATTGAFGPPHNGMGRIAAERVQAANYTGKATTAAAYLRESILEPAAYTVPEYTLTAHRMPAYTHLSQEDVDALVAMLLAQE